MLSLIHIFVVGERLAVHDDLQVLEAAAVVQGDEAEVLHVANGLDPAGDGHGGAAEGIGIGVELCDLGAIHAIPFLRDAPTGARCALFSQSFILAGMRGATAWRKLDDYVTTFSTPRAYHVFSR